DTQEALTNPCSLWLRKPCPRRSGVGQPPVNRGQARVAPRGRVPHFRRGARAGGISLRPSASWEIAPPRMGNRRCRRASSLERTRMTVASQQARLAWPMIFGFWALVAALLIARTALQWGTVPLLGDSDDAMRMV